ncbi:MAG: HAD-IC family P-type ATPase, partial [Eubacteriales bacterium]|nr:HAD-IC family P-type ATPase [Eubacteriales bacterium]
MQNRQKKALLRIAAAGVLFAAALLAGETYPWARTALFFAAYAVCGLDVLYRALRNIVRGQVFDENFLMALATVGAFALGEYAEGVAVMLFYQVGEWFQRYAVGRSRRSIAQLMDIRPDYANLLRDGQAVRVSPDDVHVGDTIVVNPGERIALDGVVIRGNSLLDTSALTGEAVPRQIGAGQDVFSGCINLNTQLFIKVTKEAGESTVAKILDMVENAASRKSRSESFITRFARYYTPAVVALATLLAVVPPLVTHTPFGPWIHRSLLFLVISCPCALVISVPLSFFGGIGGASRAGVLVKGGNYLEALARIDTIAFDKTGTL